MTHRLLLLKLIGSGERGLPWSAELPAILPCATTRSADPGDADGLLVIGGLTPEESDFAVRALRKGMPLLVTSPVDLTGEQIARLSEAALRAGALLRFANPFERRRDFCFLRKLLLRKEALFRPRSISVVRLTGREGTVTLRRCLQEELALAARLRADSPTTIRAIADDQAIERATSALLALSYAGAFTIRCSVTLTHDIDSRRVLVAMNGRSLTLPDELSLWRGTPGPTDELSAFCEAVRAGGTSFGNAAVGSRISSLWAAADESLAMGETVGINLSSAARTKPLLRLIEGGGRSGGRSRRPRLTLVAS